jgi:hypothetical protein
LATLVAPFEGNILLQKNQIGPLFSSSSPYPDNILPPAAHLIDKSKEKQAIAEVANESVLKGMMIKRN